MAITKVTTDLITALAVTAPKLAANAVTTDKLADNAVTAAKIAAGALGDQVAGITSSASATTIAGTLTSTGTITGTLATAAQTAVTSVGTLTGLAVAVGSDSDSVATITSSASGNNTQLRLGTSGNNSVISGTGGSTGGLVLKTYGTAAITVDASQNTILAGTLGVTGVSTLTGNVGIGGSPSYLLDVTKSNVGGVTDMRVFNAGTTNAATGARGIIAVANASVGDPRLVLAITGIADYHFGIDNSDSDKLKIGSGSDPSAGTNYLTIDAGKVGIGTTSPSYPFSVELDASATWLSRFYNTGTTEGDNGLLVRTGSEHDGTMVLAAYSGSSYKFNVLGDGNVGIGTTSPTVASGLGLVLNGGSAQTRIALKNSTTGDASGDGVQFALVSDDLLIQNRESAGVITFQTGDAERMRLDASGNVAIGTTGQMGNATLTLKAPTNTNTGLMLQEYDTSNAWGLYTVISDDSFRITRFASSAYSDKLTIASDGNVGIGVTPEAWHASWTPLQLGATGFVGSYQAGATDITALGSNVYSDGTYKYIETDEAVIYKQQNGTHIFDVAASGSADAAITWTTALTIENSGKVLIGTAEAATIGKAIVMAMVFG
jgi:hypothetical protein